MVATLYVFCADSNGVPSVVTYKHDFTPSQLADGEHYEWAKERASDDGYEKPFVVADQGDMKQMKPSIDKAFDAHVDDNPAETKKSLHIYSEVGNPSNLNLIEHDGESRYVINGGYRMEPQENGTLRVPGKNVHFQYRMIAPVGERGEYDYNDIIEKAREMLEAL